MRPTATSAALASRLAAAPPRVHVLLAAGAVAAAFALVLSDDPLAVAGGRAALLALALGATALLVRRRGAAAAPRSSIDVEERGHLSRDAAVALLRVGGRRLLVGYGTGGVRLLADLGASEPRGEGPRP